MKLDWNKGQNGLLPVIVQDATSKQVLMLGYMHEEAFEKTKAEKRVTFYSRSKQRLWTKGESSDNYLDVVSIANDCDQDTILVMANAHGPTCHTGKTSCFDTSTPLSAGAGEEVRFPASPAGRHESEQAENLVDESVDHSGSPEIPHQVRNDRFTINDLEKIIHQRIDDKVDGSYTYSLIQKGINKVAQKVGEEAVETVIDAINDRLQKNNIGLFNVFALI